MYDIDPELAASLPAVPAVDMTDLPATRAAMDAAIGPLVAALDVGHLDVTEHIAPGWNGAPDVRVRVCRRRDLAPGAPAVMTLHGGGFIIGSMDFNHGLAVDLATSLPLVAVNVEYRLSPEHPFPAALDDAETALRWIHASAERLGIDPARIAIHGRSAGGNLAASLCLRMRDVGGPPIAFQFLGIPALDDRLSTASAQLRGTPGLDGAELPAMWAAYLGTEPGGADVSPHAAPARADDLSGLPPAYISTMEFDPLRDEGILYGLRLLQAGVHTELHSFPRTFHGSGAITSATVSIRARAESIEVLRNALALAPVGG